MAQYKRNRGLAEYQRGRRVVEFWERHTNIAALEGRLMAALDLDLEALQERLYSGEYLTPWEREERLLKVAAEMGV